MTVENPPDDRLTTETEQLILAAIREAGTVTPGFFGVISLHFQNGRLTFIRRQQTVMPERVNWRQRL